MCVSACVHTQQGVGPVPSRVGVGEDDSRVGVPALSGSCPYLGALCRVGGRWRSSVALRDISGQEDEQVGAVLRPWSRISVCDTRVPWQGQERGQAAGV